MEKKNEYVITIGFNKKLEEHRKVAGILNGMGRTKAQYIVNAVIAYGEEGRQKVPLNRNSVDYEQVKYFIQQAVEEYMKKLAVAEKAKESNIDIVAGYTGEMLGQIFQWKQDEWSRDLESMGFYMGKFIYLLDAYEDLKQDQKKGNYNPLAYVQMESKEEYETFCRSTLTCLMAECAKSFERMPILQHAEILRNILYSGVWTKYEYLKLKEKKTKP